MDAREILGPFIRINPEYRAKILMDELLTVVEIRGQPCCNPKKLHSLLSWTVGSLGVGDPESTGFDLSRFKYSLLRTDD